MKKKPLVPHVLGLISDFIKGVALIDTVTIPLAKLGFDRVPGV